MGPGVTCHIGPTMKTDSHWGSDGCVTRAELGEISAPIAVVVEKQANFLQNSGRAQKGKKPGGWVGVGTT